MTVVRCLSSEGNAPRTASMVELTNQTGILVECEELSPEELRGALLSGSPRADLVVADEVTVADLIRRGLLEPLGRRAHHAGIDLDDFPQAAIDRFRASDVVYAIPAAAGSNLLIYRADLIERFGLNVPATWEELKQHALTVQATMQAEGDHDFAGIAAPGLAGHDQNFAILGSTLFPSWGWQWNRGSKASPLVHQPATVDALTFYAGLLTEAGPPHAPMFSREMARQRFSEGKALFLIDRPSAIQPAETGLARRIALIPAGPSGRPEPGLASPCFCIPHAGSHTEAAWELLRFLISPEVMTALALDGESETPRSSILSSHDYATRFGLEFQQVMGQTRRFARINTPLIANGWDLGDIVGAAAEATIAGAQSADEALRVAQAMIDGMTWNT